MRARSASIFALALLQSALVTTFLAHQAWLMVDAIGRTLMRLDARRRHLLQWVPAAQAALGSAAGSVWVLSRAWRALVVIGAALPVFAVATGHGTWIIAGALSVAVGRVASHRSVGISRSPVAARHRCPYPPRTLMRCLRLIARRTWRFFETFVTAADHMLPPDNFQETPAPVVAHRTSPTNHRSLSSLVSGERARFRLDGNASMRSSGWKRRCRP